MITPGEYDLLEQQAIEKYPELYEDQRWAPDEVGHHTSDVDFPLRVSDINECSCLLNRFQRGRYNKYICELGGLTKEEIDKFRLALSNLETLALKDYEPPMDQLAAAISIYRNIKLVKKGPVSILEIGPGSGLNSLFYSMDPEIIAYTQIETTQSLYILQELINSIGYKSCNHLTWWQELPNIEYDVINTNACLAEMTDNALTRYFDLFDEKSHETTVLLIQDAGGHVNRSGNDTLKYILSRGWYLNRVGNPNFHWWFSKNDKGFEPIWTYNLDNIRYITKEELLNV